MSHRMDIKAILSDPIKRRRLILQCIVAAQAREEITTTPEQAARAYDQIQSERHEDLAR